MQKMGAIERRQQAIFFNIIQSLLVYFLNRAGGTVLHTHQIHFTVALPIRQTSVSRIDNLDNLTFSGFLSVRMKNYLPELQEYQW